MKKHSFIPALIAAALAVGGASAAAFSSSAAGVGSVAGDVNADGVFSSDDLALMQNWLLAVPGAELPDWQAGDLNGNGEIDVFDLAMMRSLLADSIQNNEEVGYSIVFSGDTVILSDANGGTVTNCDALRVEGQTVTIVKPGEYSVSGSSTNGQLVVDVDKNAYPDGKVTLELNGLELSHPELAPIYVASVGDECVISVKKGTANTIFDGTSHTDSYTDSDGDVKEVNAAIFSRDDLKIKGKGTLIVNGNYADGIACTDDLRIYNGTIIVTAVDDGIRGKDSVRIGDADDTDFADLSVTVTTNNGDGIRSTNSSDEEKGFVEINGGAVTVDSHSDGIQAARDITVNGGDINIRTYEGSEYQAAGTGASGTGESSSTPGSGFTPGGGGGGFTPGGGGFTPGGGGGDDSGHDLGLDLSAKGIKAGDGDADIAGSITINGGTLTIDSTDDAVHCGDTLMINGGDITISTADDALHCDKYLYINGGRVYVSESYEGIEAMQIYVTDGDITVYAEDDPMNAGEKGAQKTVDVSNDNCILQIDGGTLHIFVTNEREGDGLDSNGKIVINGGTIYAEGSVSGPDSALDSDGEMIVNGGTVMAIGGLGRGELPEYSSQQCSVYWGDSSTTYQSGSVIKLLDSTGRELVSYTSEQTFKCAVVSCPEITIGGSYTLTVNGNTVATFNVTSALTKQGDEGSSGGGGGQGGGR